MKKTRVALVYNAYTDGAAESLADSGSVRSLRQHDPRHGPGAPQGRQRGRRRPARRRPPELPADPPAPEAGRRLQPVRRRRPRRPLRDARGRARPDHGLSDHGVARPRPRPEPVQVHVRQPPPGRRDPHPARHDPVREDARRRRPEVDLPADRPAEPGARRHRRGPRFRRPDEDGAPDEGPRDPDASTTSPPWPSGSSPGREFNVGLVGGKKLRVLPLAEVDYSRLPEKGPADHVLRGQVDRDLGGVPADLGDLSGRRRARARRPDLEHGGQGLPGHRRLGIRPGGYPARRGPRAPRPRGELQSLPRRRHRPGPVGADRRGSPTRSC